MKKYRMISAKNQGCYKAGELICVIKSDNIKKDIEYNERNGQYEVAFEEIKEN